MTGPLGIELILFPSNLSPQPGQCFGPWFLRGKQWIRSSHCLLCRLQNRSDRSYFFYGGQERELLNENSRAPFCIYFRHDAISQYHLQWTHSLSELGPSMIEQTSFYVLRIFTFTWLPPGHHMDRNKLTAIFHWVYSRSRKSSHIDVITWNFRDMFISRFWCAHISRHFCANLIFWITLISRFEHHNLNFMGNNVKIAKHNSGTKCQLYNKAVFTTSTSSSYLYVNFCRYYIRKKGLKLKVQCYFYILSFSVKNRNNTDPSPHVSLKVKTEVKPVQVIYVCI